jgi:hypothetical protein
MKCWKVKLQHKRTIVNYISKDANFSVLMLNIVHIIQLILLDVNPYGDILCTDCQRASPVYVKLDGQKKS